MFFYIITVLVILIGKLIHWHIKCTRKFSSLDSLPGPKPLPFLGNVLEFGFTPVDKLKNLYRLSNTYGPIIKNWISCKNLYIIITDPELCEFILSSPKYIKKSDDYDILNCWLGNGLLVSSGTYWQKRRKILTPAFHFKILEDFVTIFNKESNKLIKHLANNIDIEFNIFPYITACTLDIICETAMGTSVKAQDNKDNDYVKAVKTMCNIFIERIFSSWKQFDYLFKFSSLYKEQIKALNIIHGFTKSVIKERREKLLHSDNTSVKDDEYMGIKKKTVFLDVLLQATIDGQPLSDEDIREEVDTFMFEGHDTIASLLAFSMYELSRNIDIQNKVYAEIKDVYGNDKNYEPKLQDLNDMKYTELVIKEVLRLYPSVPYISRSLEEDIHFKGTVYPKDLRPVIFTYAMHRRADLFPEPNKFNPDRFLEKNINNNPYSYLPFSAGPRNCIGQKFAMYEAKVLISKIIMHFELHPANSKYDVILSGEVVLKTTNGVHVTLKHR